MFGRLVANAATSAGLLILLTGLTKAAENGYCGAYCTSDGQQMGFFFCPATNHTTTDRLVYCCGSATNKFCCSDIKQLVPESANYSSYCADGSSTNWVIVVTIVMTVVVFLLGLIGCLCLCHKKYGCTKIFCTETGEEQSSSEPRTESTATHPSTTLDFDPTSPCAFEPPAYDSLPKHPPAYSKIFTISTDCSDNSPSNSDRTNLQSVSYCNVLNQTHSLPLLETVPRDPRQSSPPSVVDQGTPDVVSLNPPPYYSLRPTSGLHRCSLSLAIELHPSNLAVAGSLLSSPQEASVLSSTV